MISFLKFTFDCEFMKYSYYVLGNFEESSDFFDVISPHTMEKFAEVSLISSERAKEVLTTLGDLKREIASIPLDLRLRVLMEWSKEIENMKKDLIESLINESGKTIHYAEGEINALLERFKFVEREIEFLQPEIKDGDYGFGTKDKYALVIKEPLGIITCIAPFNYPVLTLMNKVIPAILGGNIVIAKPSLKTPISGVLLARAWDKASDRIGFDKRVFNVFIGRSSEIGDLIVSHESIDGVSFTGSTYIGQKISQKVGMKKFHAELGGKGTALVLDDCDMEYYAKEICDGAFKFSGQRCDSLNRVIVIEKYKEKLLNALLNEIGNWNYGDVYDHNTKITPLIDSDAVNKVRSLVEDALSKGAKVIYGYEFIKDNVMLPTILDGVNESMDIYYEEIFGPVLTITTVKDKKEAIEKALDNKYGLDASIFTSNILEGIEIAKKLNDGSVTINAHPTHSIGYFPYGGNKLSGIGREGVFVSLKEFVKTKTIIIKR